MSAEQNFGDVLSERTFVPCGMAHTIHHARAETVISNRATGYAPAGIAGLELAPFVDWSSKAGNGSLVSTVGDLHRFHQALSSGSLIEPSWFDRAHQPGAGNQFGWFMREGKRGRSLVANGRSPGFTASLERRADGACIVVLSNLYSTVSQTPIARDLGAMLDGDSPSGSALTTVSREPGELALYAGTYQGGTDFLIPDAVVTVEVIDGGLVMTLDGGSALSLVPTTPDEFIDRMFWGRVSFSAGDGHPYGELIWQLDGHDYRVARTHDLV
jgi:hypothetical protein